MRLCLVTDRRRLAAAVGCGPGEIAVVLRAQVVAAARAGVEYVQVREGDLDAGALVALVRLLVDGCRPYPTTILVNDRLDVAIAAGAGGVHLKESSFAPEEARRLAPPPFIVSAAVHTAVTAAARHTADLLVAGTVLPTAAKSRAEYLDRRGLAAIVEAAPATPVLGIGGLDLAAMPLVAASGAAGAAAVGAFIPPAGHDLAKFVQKRVSDMRFAFDSAARDL